LRYYYSLDSQEGLGAELQGTYNTFLDQGCSLFIANSNSSTQLVQLSITRFDGSQIVVGEFVPVAGKGVVEYNLCSQDIPNVYGVVKVTPEQPGSVMAWVVRKGAEDDYRLSTPVR